MKLLMFSGNSLANRTWIYSVKQGLPREFSGAYIQDYHHWKTGSDWIDIEYEMNAVRKCTNKLDQPYAIFAKSIGTVLALRSIAQGFLAPRFLLFLGIPLDYILPNEPSFNTNFKRLHLPATIIQNYYDPVGSSKDLKKYLAGLNPSTNLIACPGDTHNYLDYDLINKELLRLLGLAS